LSSFLKAVRRAFEPVSARLPSLVAAVAGANPSGDAASSSDQSGRIFLVQHTYVARLVPRGGVEPAERLLEAPAASSRRRATSIVEPPPLKRCLTSTTGVATRPARSRRNTLSQPGHRSPTTRFLAHGFVAPDALARRHRRERALRSPEA